VDESVSSSKIESRLLGLEQLRDLLCLEELRTANELDLQVDILDYYSEAVSSGETSPFVRFATTELIKFRASGDVQEAKSTHFALEALRPVADELKLMTTREQRYVMEKGLLQAEVARFHELADLLQQCSDLVYESLCSKPDSVKGIAQIRIIRGEVELAGGSTIKQHLRDLNPAKKNKASINGSVLLLSTGAIEQLKSWHHPLRLEIALSTMLEALPKLEDAVFWKMKVDAWVPILVRHGMEVSATKLAAALNERRTAAVAAQSAAKPTISPLPQDSARHSQASDPTPRAKLPNASRVNKNKKKADKIDMRAVGYFDISSDYPYASMTPDTTPARGPTFSEVFKPTQRRPMRAITAGSRRRFEGRLMGGEPVATPGTVASSRYSSVAPTPILQGPRAPRQVGKGRRRAKVQETIDEEEASEGDESDEEDRGNEAISVAGSWTSDQYGNVNGGHGGEEEMSGSGYSSEGYEDVDGDSEMGNSSE
jgi:hypothetical protein